MMKQLKISFLISILFICFSLVGKAQPPTDNGQMYSATSVQVDEEKNTMQLKGNARWLSKNIMVLADTIVCDWSTQKLEIHGIRKLRTFQKGEHKLPTKSDRRKLKIVVDINSGKVAFEKL
jgi:ERCC4-related helicase